MTTLVELAAGQRPTYVCTRLFHPSGRLLGTFLEGGVRAGLSAALTDAHLTATGPVTFLPYRDSNGAITPRAGHEFTRDIYLLDAAQVRRAGRMVIPLDDLQVDSGIAFELGLAWGLGIPTLTVLLNSVSLQHRPSGEPLRALPVLSMMSGTVIDAGAFPLSGLSSEASTYQEQVLASLSQMASLVREAVYADPVPPVSPRPERPLRLGTVHLEGGVPHAGTDLLIAHARTALRAQGWTVTTSARWDASPGESLVDRAARDVETALAAQVVLNFGDGADVDAEVAAIQGARTALGCPTVLLRSAPLGIQDGPVYASVCNLMLAHSAWRVAESLAQALQWISDLHPQESVAAPAPRR